MNAKPVIVLGSPRSGTSVTAGILQALGVDMGNIRAADALNPRGYFEDWDFLRFGDRVFTACDADANGFRPPTLAALDGVFSNFRDEARTLLDKRESKSHGMWGWKTTHTCFLLNLYLPLLVRQPFVIVVLRNPLATADSISRYVRHEIKRDMYEPKSTIESLRIVLEYESALIASLQASALENVMYISYEDLIKSPDSVIDRITQYLSLQADPRAKRLALAQVRRKSPSILHKLKHRLAHRMAARKR